MKTSPLVIRLLGPVEILYEGKPRQISRRIERAILYFLAIENRPVSRTALIDMFWTNADQVDPRRTLRTALSRMRKELPNPDSLITELDQVWLDLESCQIDVEKFERLYQSLENVLSVYQKKRPLPAQIVNQIEEALNLWHGDEIIEGENLTSYQEFENWRRNNSQTLGHHRRFLMNRLAEHYRAAGRPEAALDLFVQLGRMDILDVSLHLSVLEILTGLGLHQEAIEYCDTLEIAIEQTYNAPLPNAILSKYQYSQIQINASKEIRVEEWPTALTMQLRLVGRQSELEQLHKAFFQGGIVVIQGELGSGKTRLVKELFQTVIPTPNLFLAPSREMENTLPLSPIIHCLRRHIPGEVWKEFDPVWLNQMCLLLPELEEIREEVNQDNLVRLPSGKQHLFEALHQVFRFAAHNYGRILFFLDDAQWADHQTLQAVSYLVMQGFFDEQGVLIIATRSEEPNRDLDEMVDRFHRTYPVTAISLNGLSPNDLRLLAHQALHKQPPMSFIDQLFRETNGNPFLTLEIIRNILELPGDIENFTTTARLPLPKNIHAIIRKRLNRLDENERQLLLCAAVLGNVFSLDLLQSIAGLSPVADPGIIDPLVKAGFIQSIHEGKLQLAKMQFVHEKMREVVIKEATPVRLQILHRHAADRLSETPQAAAKSAVIANHYLTGGSVSEAFNWFLKSADYAWSLGAKEDTLHAYVQAESLFRNAPEGYFTKNDALLLYQHWSEFAYQSNQDDMLEKAGIKLQYLGEREHDPLLIGVSQISLANACFLRLKMDTGLELIEKAITNLERTKNSISLIEALLRQGTFQWWKSDFTAAIHASRRALTISEAIETDSPRMISYKFNARQIIGMAYYAKGDADTTRQYAQDTYDSFYHRLNTFDRMRMLHLLAYANILAANYEQSEFFINKGLEITHALENAFVKEILFVALAKSKFIQGHLDEAYRHAVEALTMGEKSGNLHTIVGANTLIGNIFCMLQNYSRALQYYRVAQIRAGYSSNSLYRCENDIYLARLLSLMGQLSEARDVLAPTLDITKRTGMAHLYVLAILISGFCDVSERNFPGAEEKFKQVAVIAEQKGLRYELIWSKVGQFRIALSRHQFDTAHQLIQDVLDGSQALNTAWQKLQGLELCAQLNNARKEPPLMAYRSMFESLVKEIEAHTKSDPLRQDFINAKRYWEQGHHYP